MSVATAAALAGVVLAAVSLIPEALRRWHERQHR
jgi:hypothetical protein